MSRHVPASRLLSGKVHEAGIVSTPFFLDPKGERQNV